MTKEATKNQSKIKSSFDSEIRANFYLDFMPWTMKLKTKDEIKNYINTKRDSVYFLFYYLSGYKIANTCLMRNITVNPLLKHTHWPIERNQRTE